MYLIDADATGDVFLEIMNLPKDYAGPSDIMISIDAVFSVLGQVPAVDPVKHGNWIRHLAIGWSEAHYTCSCCGYYLHFDRRENANYCPKCGAKMDGE